MIYRNREFIITKVKKYQHQYRKNDPCYIWWITRACWLFSSSHNPSTFSSAASECFQHQHHLKEPKNEMEFNLRPQWRLWNYTSQKPNRGKCGLIHQWVCLATYNKCFKRGEKWHYGRMCFSRTKFEQVNTNLNHHVKNNLGNQRKQKSKRKT